MSKATPAASVASAFLLAAILVLEFAQLRAATRAWSQPRWEYEVFSIDDGEWGTKAQDLGASGWEIVTARRASDSDGTVAYECIAKRRRPQ